MVAWPQSGTSTVGVNHRNPNREALPKFPIQASSRSVQGEDWKRTDNNGDEEVEVKYMWKEKSEEGMVAGVNYNT